MISIELLRARIGLHSLSKSSNFPRTSSDSLLTSTTSIILFSILLACVVYSLLIIGGIELNPGPIQPFQGKTLQIHKLYCYRFQLQPQSIFLTNFLLFQRYRMGYEAGKGKGFINQSFNSNNIFSVFIF